MYAFSRVDRDEKVEYLVATNNATTDKTVSIPTLTTDAAFTPLYGGGQAFTTDATGVASVTVPALSSVVFTADGQVTAPAEAAALSIAVPEAGAALTGLAPVSADIADAWAETSFAWRVVGDDEWTPLGTAEDTTPRVFHDVAGLAAGTLVEYRAVSTDAAGTRSAASTYASVGNGVTHRSRRARGAGVAGRARAAGGRRVRRTSAFPAASTCEAGCPGDWQPECANVQMEKVDGIWRLTLPDLAAGSYMFKIATEKSWDENYGAGGVASGGDIPLTHDGGAITFYFDPRTKNIRTTADGPIITLAGLVPERARLRPTVTGCPRAWPR